MELGLAKKKGGNTTLKPCVQSADNQNRGENQSAL